MARLMRLLAVLALAVVVANAQANNLCRVVDDVTNAEYDLRGLYRSMGSNYMVQDMTNDVKPVPKHMYLLNPCGELLAQTVRINDGTPVNCDPKIETESCQIDMRDRRRDPKDLGKLKDVKVVDEGMLLMTYEGGEPCADGAIQRRMTILFNCDRTAGVGQPRFKDEDTKCDYSFTWATSYACKLTTPTVVPPPTGAPKECMVVDSSDNTRYSLSALVRPSSNYLVEHGDMRYFLNVCDDVHMQSIGSGFGAVMTKASNQAYSRKLGRTTDKILVRDGYLEQQLTGGDTCDADPTKTYSAAILYYCREDQGLGSPRFLEVVDQCRYVFSWSSSAACGESIGTVCKAVDKTTGATMDLSALMFEDSAPANWEAVSAAGDADRNKYFLNICNDLVEAHRPCRAGSSICQVPADTPHASRSLGTKGELIVDDGEAILRFVDGDQCPSGARITTDIYFMCDPSSLGTPRLLSVKNDCQYLFSWKTSAACEGGGVAATPAPGSGGLGAGAIVAITLVCLFASYFIFGAIYLKFVKEEEGMRVIPHWDFFVAAYYTVAGKCTGAHRPPPGAIQL